MSIHESKYTLVEKQIPQTMLPPKSSLPQGAAGAFTSGSKAFGASSNFLRINLRRSRAR
jgi:hypothetical protein